MQFNLRTVLLLAVPIALLLTGFNQCLIRGHNERTALERLQAVANVEFRDPKDGNAERSKVIPNPSFIDSVFGEGVLAHVAHVRFHSDTDQLEQRDFAILSSLKNLQVVSLSGGIVTDDALKHLETLEGLEVVVLDNTSTTSIGIHHLRAISTLDSLLLFGGNVNDEMLMAASQLEKLRYLDIRDAPITRDGLAPLRDSQRLREIVLYNCDEIQGDLPRYLTDHFSSERPEVFLFPISSSDDEIIAELRRDEILVSSSVAGSSGFASIGLVLRSSNSIEMLCLDCTRLSDIRSKRLFRVPHLWWLSIGFTELDPDLFRDLGTDNWTIIQNFDRAEEAQIRSRLTGVQRK